VSHGKERTEKKCLNCNTELIGYYCHVCGQENREPKDSIWGLVSHFLYDITHFDGKFFSTLKYLILKPGFLSLEYIRGRRAGYLNPIRMYVFSSAFFFIIFFSLYNVDDMNFSSLSREKVTKETMDKIRDQAFKNAKTKEDSLTIEKGLGFAKAFPVVVKDTFQQNTKPKVGFSIGEAADVYSNVEQYDSAQRTLPAAERDGWFKRLMNRRFLYLKDRYQHNSSQLFKDLFDKFEHSFPALLFVSLPLYALYLKLLYARRKQYYYVDHGIFLIHLYIFSFLFLLVYFALDKLKRVYHINYIEWVELLFFLYGIFYAYKSMRNFYRQGRAKTILKFVLLNIMATVTIVFLFAVFFSISVFRI